MSETKEPQTVAEKIAADKADNDAKLFKANLAALASDSRALVGAATAAAREAERQQAVADRAEALNAKVLGFTAEEIADTELVEAVRNARIHIQVASREDCINYHGTTIGNLVADLFGFPA